MSESEKSTVYNYTITSAGDFVETVRIKVSRPSALDGKEVIGISLETMRETFTFYTFDRARKALADAPILLAVLNDVEKKEKPTS